MLEKRRTSFRWVHFVLFVLALTLTVRAMQAPPPPPDPGVRVGANGAGGAIAGLTTKEGKFFDAGLDAILERQSVRGTVPGTELGLGPRFNLDSCGGCHAQPATGGTSPDPNPQFFATIAPNPIAPGNVRPGFITEHGPVIEPRFKYTDPPTNSIRDGGVHDLFVITGRSDAVGCNIAQPDFVTAAAQNNLIFRIPTPLFGAGLIESIADSTILKNITDPPAAFRHGVTGHENREGNAGTITRFGWKAQVKSLVIFSGEAYNVEQGVTNEAFQQERDETTGCVFNPIPENHTNYEQTQPQAISSDIINFANFMLFLAPPTPFTSGYTSTNLGNVTAADISSGFNVFNSVGCAVCHRPSMQTASTSSAALSNKTVSLFSDLLVHHMGSVLADGITQGLAGDDEFRTAPLWGLGKRIHFLHDGRTNDLMQAIGAHGGEATTVIGEFNALGTMDKQNLLKFLRSL
jgi:CxxC motif-containing protein (DUF1111 family)